MKKRDLKTTIAEQANTISALLERVAALEADSGETPAQALPMPSLLTPDNAKPYTVLIDFDAGEDSAYGSVILHVFGTNPASAVLNAQRMLYRDLTTSLTMAGVDLSEGLTLYAHFAVPGHHDQCWPPKDHNPGPDDPDPCYYEPETDPLFNIG